MAPPASSLSSSKPSRGRSLRSAPPASHSSSMSKANAAFQHLDGPVQTTLDEFTRLFHSIQSSAFLGKPLTETLISKEGGVDEEDEEEEESRNALGQAKEEIKANNLTSSFAPYPHLVPLPPLSTTLPSTLLPYQKLNLASTLLILQFISILPLKPSSSSSSSSSKRKRGRPPLDSKNVDPNASSSSSSDERKEGEEMMRELKKGLFGGVMSLVQPEDAWEGGEDWLEKSAGVNLGKTRKGGVEGAMAEGKERKRRRTEGWKERLEVMLEVCTAIVLLSNPTDSNTPIDSIQDPRIQEIFKGDFLDDDDHLVARTSFKGPSGAVFRDSNERRVVSGTMWKKASIARAVLLNNLTADQMNAKYPLDKMAQIVGSYLVARLWLPFLHLQEQSTSNPKPFSFLNPPTPGQILTGKDFGGPPSPPPANKKTTTAASKKTATAAAKSKAPATSKKSKPVAAPADQDDEEEEEDEVIQEGSSLDEIDNDLAPSTHADDDDDEEEEPVELSEKAKGKRSTRLVPEEDEDDDEEEESDSDMIEILDEASSDSDDFASDVEDEDAQEEEEEEEDVAREPGITEADLVGFVARDPGEEEGLSRRELTPLRRSLAKDRRLPENKRLKETGAALPREVVQLLEGELAKGKSAEQIVATISKSIKTALAISSTPSSSSKPKSTPLFDDGTDEEEEEEDDPPPKLTAAQLAKQEKLCLSQRNRILQQNQGDEEDDDEMIEVEEAEEDEDEADPMALRATPNKKSNSFTTPSGYQYATGGNQRGRKSWTAQEDKCLLDAMKLIYPQSKMWSKVIALHGINGIDSTALKDRNVQSCKDRARNIKTQMLKGGKVPPEYLSGISVDKATQALLDRRDGIVVDNPALAPAPRLPRVVAEDDGEEEIDQLDEDQEEEEEEGESVRKKARVGEEINEEED